MPEPSETNWSVPAPALRPITGHCRARSRAEFAAKIGIVVEEADESCLWIELIMESDLLPHGRCAPLLAEANELVAIMIATQKSLSRSSRKDPKSEIRNPK